MKKGKKAINIPNMLTFLRFLLSPVFFILLLIHRVGWAIIVFILVALTDAIDGWVARKFKQRTAVGAALDPFADKFMIFLALIALVKEYQFPLWAVPLFILRDLISLLGSVLVLVKNKSYWKASKLGKITTSFQIATIIFYIINLPFKLYVLYAAIIFSVSAGIGYGIRGIGILKAVKERAKKG